MSNSVSSAPVPLNMPSPSGLGEAPPHEIRGLVPYGLSWEDLWPKLLIFAAGLLLCALLYAIWRKFRKKKTEVLVPEDPFLVLERRLANLLPPEPFEVKRSTQYFFDLNMIFREFIELSSGIPATDLTLQELKEPLRLKSSISRDVTEDMIKFLERSEAIKFAGLSTELREAQESHLQVKQWVSYLRPRRLTQQEDIQNL